MTETALIGECLCGAYRFSVEGPIGEVRLCHCDLCRRSNGSAFSANARIPLQRFSFLTDKATITEYQSSKGAWKAFCSVCGSPAYSRVERDPGFIRVRLGTLPRDARASILAHVWVGSKADWDTIGDDLPCFTQSADGPLR